MRRTAIKTWWGRPVASVVREIQADLQVGPPMAGRKRLAVLRSSICAVEPRGHAVLLALFGPDAGARLADGTLAIPAGLCDALIEVMAHLPIALTPAPPQGGEGNERSTA